MLSSMRNLEKVCVDDCPKLDEIHIAGVLESLEELCIVVCESFRRLVYIDIKWESSHESSLVLAPGVFNKLRELWLHHCPKILGIQVVGTSESSEKLSLNDCHHLRSLGLSNLKNLEYLWIEHNQELRIVEGLDELKFLNNLTLLDCRSLESLIDVSTTKLPLKYQPLPEITWG
ncbi:hypothetical protein NL676_009093 [Syzygium grande]|nr:hypothetical protein NL676_009093 [Syzygium grande]